MKKLQLLTTAFVACLFTLTTYSQCTAAGSVTLTGNPGEVYITDNSTTSGATFSWIHFYDAGTWTGITDVYLQPSTSTATYTFSQNGTYGYYLQVEDTISGCYDSIGGMFTISNLASCDANFNSYMDTNNVNGVFFNSTGNNSSSATYDWNFGDGSFGTGAFTSYTYAAPGAYAVCLVVSDTANGGCSQTFCDSVYVNSGTSCYANANVTVNQTGTPGLLSINDNSTSSTPSSVSWMAFYDQNGTWLGDVPLQPNNFSGTFQVPSNGIYYYSFVVQDSTITCEDSISSVITVNNYGNSACDANYNYYPDSLGGIYFDAPTHSGSGFGYYWDFGDGNTSNMADPTHYYGANGTYTVCLSVWNNNNFCSDTVCNTIVINNASGTGCAGNANFTYSSNNGNDFYFAPNNVLSNASYQWDFGNGNNSFNATAQQTYNAATSGWYSVCLIVVNNNNCTDYYCDSIYVTAVATGPSCDATFYGYSDSTSSNMVQFYNFGNNGSGATYIWDLGDGNTATGQYPNHTYAASGWYAVCLTVSDNSGAGCTQTYCDSVYADGGSTATSCNAEFILFQDSIGSGVYYAWNTSTGSNLSYYWDFGDGNTSNLAYPIHTYNAVGVYGICLSVSNNSGCTSTFCDTIYVVVKAAGTTLNVLQPGATVGVEEVNTFNEVKLYPNPSNGAFNLTINVAKSVEASLLITNLMGQTLEKMNLQLNQGENLINMDESHLSTGVYLLNVINESTGEVTMIKLIKE